MPPYQQQPPVAQGWDRWQQHQHTSSDYSMMDHMVTYDPRAVPSTTALQRPALTAQYSMPTSYTDSPVTPMSTSSYGTASHFADYQPYAYQGPTPSTNFSQVPLRGATRPMAPPTPPLDEERGLRLGDGHNVNTVKSTLRKSPRRSASVVKSEVGGEDGKEIKTCAVLIKEDRTLQFESKKFVDVLLKKAATRKQPGDGKGDESTPESAATPVPDDNAGRQKPFKKHGCPTCGARFFQAAQLQTHQRSHTGEKPFGCHICGRRVSQPGNLKAHIRRHTHEKPFKCDICEYPFANRGGLKVHIRNKHQLAPKSFCPIPKCEKTFSTIGNMKVHIDKFHVPELEYYFKLLDDREFESLPEDVRQILETLLRTYKNSNRGIKGRGPDGEFEKEEKKRQSAKRQAAHQEMTPVSPDSSGTLHEYRQYYDQPHQQNYNVLPHPGQQPAQQSTGYLQLPLHQPQHPVYHGLPQPATYSMTWSQGSQYH